RFGGVTAVDDCSFGVPEGSVTALVGPNGSGKTTAFNLITGYARPDSGSVRFAGASIRRPDPVRLARRGLTRTFQQARVFADLTSRGLTFLVVEHNMNLVMRLCDPVVVLDHGTKLAEGRPDDVRNDPRVLDAYLGG